MKLSVYNSTKIGNISFILILMVVYIHSYYLESVHYTLSNGIQKIVGSITDVAVPLFYAISGFLFFNGVSEVSDCLPKIKKRVHTLIIPYLIWNIIFVLWYVLLSLLPIGSLYVNSDVLSGLSLLRPIESFYCLFVEPAGFHLWFLRDLIVFVIISPLLYYLIKYTKWFAFIILVILTGWMIRCWLSYFVLGGIVVMYKSQIIDFFKTILGRRLTICCVLVYLGYSIFSGFENAKMEDGIVYNYLFQFYILIPIIAIWGGYDLIVNENHPQLKLLIKNANYTFFIYLFHEPTFNILKKIGIKVLGNSEFALIGLYLINPILMVITSIAIGKLLRKYVPCIYKILTGNR